MDTLYSLLQKVEKPGRYVGQEINQIIKDPKEVKIRFAFGFPDLYEIGMSHLGLQILYGVLNQQEDIWCQRFFAVAKDMEDQMRKHQLPLFTLESKSPIGDFDFVGFTLQYELSYTNILNMLDLGEVPLYSKDRKAADPIVIMGGPCAYNAEPLADFADIILMGEGEESLLEVMDIYRKFIGEKDTKNVMDEVNEKEREEIKGKKWRFKTIDDREKFLLEIARNVEGAYVPRFYEGVTEEERLQWVRPLREDIPKTIKKRIVRDLDQSFYPEAMIVPNIEVVHQRTVLEIFRGCTRGCRFCQAGMIYRPIRERSIETLMKQARALSNSSGYDEMSLTSLSSSDYSNIEGLLRSLVEEYEKENTSVSLPSLRLDKFSLDTANLVQKTRKSGLTFAPEAGSQRMRDVINKGVTENDLVETLTTVFENGWHGVKLYFMMGLPTETFEDLDGIASLAYRVIDLYRDINKGKFNKKFGVTISVSTLVPKAFTPFQWHGQDSADLVREKQKYLKGKLLNRNISYNYHDIESGFIEAVFARGDRRLSHVLEKAWRNGCIFDGWHEHFSLEKWMRSFEEAGVDPYFYGNREIPFDEKLPWDHIDVGVTKAFLLRERQTAQKEAETKDCRQGCHGCGINQDIGKGLC